MFGAKMRWPRGEAGALERGFWDEQDLPDWSRPALPRYLVPNGGRRPLRVPLDSAAAREFDDGLELDFGLPAGSYATVLIAALFDEAVAEGAAQ